MKRKQFLDETKGQPVKELAQKARALAEERMKLRFRKASGQLDQSHRLREVRRNLARVLTLKRQSELKEKAQKKA